MAKVSVIIPTHNRWPLLERALTSLISQTWQDFDLWLIDDGSTDNTRENFLAWVEEQGEQARFHYAYQNHGGVSRARNYGVHLSRGEYLAFLDSDDEWLPFKLELQWAMIQEGWQLVHAEEVWFRNGAQVKQLKKHAKTGGRIFSSCVRGCCISPSTVLMERSLFEEVGGFREDFPVCEDYDLWLKICSRYPVGFIEQPVIFKHAGHGDQLSMQLKAMDYYRVKALETQLSNPALLPEEREVLLEVLREKCEILLSGFKKYRNPVRHLEISAILAELGG